MGAAWPEATCLGFLWCALPAWTTAITTSTSAIASATSTTAVTAATFVARTISTTAVTAATFVIASTASTTTVTTATFVIAATASTTTAAITIATISPIATPAFANELCGDAAFVLTRPEDLQRLLLGTLGLWGQDIRDKDTVYCKVGIDAYNVANSGPLIEQGAIQLALGLLCTGLSPGVRTIIAFTGELDFEASRHKDLR